MIIYLKDSVQTCIERIRKRNRPYEQDIDIEFLNGLEAGYDLLFSGWSVCPIIRIDGARFDGGQFDSGG